MGIALFGRVWELEIGPAGGQGRIWQGSPQNGLRIEAKVEKTGSSTPNKLTLSILNLSPDSRHWIEGYDPNTWAIRLSAGYQAEGPRLIFTGNLALASSDKGTLSLASGKALSSMSKRQGPDWITSLEGRDGLRAYKAVVLSKTLAKGVSEEAVVREVAKAMGVTIGKLQGFPKGAKFDRGRTLCGAASAELDSLCKTHSLRWSIQDGVLQILPVATALGSIATVLSASSGLISSPERTETGVKVTSLMRPDLNPGSLIEVQAKDLSGLYVAENVTHDLDSYEQRWYSAIDAVRPAT